MYQVNRRNLMDITDVLALIMGMQAGFSFISRIMKFILEKWNCLNYTEEESTNLILSSEDAENNDNKEGELELSSNFK